MAEQMQVSIGAALDPTSKSKIISDIQSLCKNQNIPINVTANISEAENKIKTLISTYQNKTIKINIDTKSGSSGARSVLSEYEKIASRLQTTANKAFNGITVPAKFGSINEAINSVSRIKSELNDLNKTNVKVDIDFASAEAGETGLVLTIQEADKAVQSLHYSMQEVNGQKLYILDNTDVSAITNANTQLTNLSKTVSTLRGSLDAAENIKISSNNYATLSGNLKTIENELKQTASETYITQDALDALYQKVAKFKGEFSSAKTSFSKNSTDIKQMKTDYESLLALEQKFNSFLSKNTKSQSFGNVDQLKTQIQTLKEIYQSTETIDHDSFTKLNAGVQEFMSNVANAGMTGQTAFQSVLSKAQELGTYLMTSQMFFYMRQGIEAMVQNIVELDSAMTELKKTTDGSAASYSNFLTQSAQIAQEVGTKVSDIVQSAAEWSRSGYDLSQVAELAQASAMYVNVSEYDNVSDATTSLISTMKAFGIESSNVMTILDAFNAVGNTTATTSEGLGEAMLRSASALSTAGNSLQESLALVVAANDVVQNPEKVGNGLKTIALRLRSTKGELEELGEESDGAVESITKLQTQLLNATNGQVNIFDSNGDFKGTYQILSELANVWSDLDSIQQANITTWVAGATQANVFSSIMQNFGEGAEALQTALNSEGSAVQENARYMDSIEGRVNQLKASFQELSSTVINTDFAKGIVSGAQQVVEIINQIVSGLGTIPTILAGAGIAAFIKNFAQQKFSYFYTGRNQFKELA